MKLLTKVSLILLLMSLYSILMKSCICRDIDEYKIIGLNDLTILQISGLEALEVDTITGVFSLNAEAEIEIAATAIPDFSLFSNAYATSCDIEILNPFDENTLTLTSDKDFTFDTQLIPANTDFLQLEGIAYQTDYSAVRVSFSNDFINKADFDNTDYTFRLTIETEDGLSFVAENGVVMGF